MKNSNRILFDPDLLEILVDMLYTLQHLLHCTCLWDTVDNLS